MIETASELWEWFKSGTWTPAVLRRRFCRVWHSDHRVLPQLGADAVVEMIRAAEFPAPLEKPAILYRGVRGRSGIVYGFSFTDSLTLAHRYSTIRRYGMPLPSTGAVVMITVPPVAALARIGREVVCDGRELEALAAPVTLLDVA